MLKRREMIGTFFKTFVWSGYTIFLTSCGTVENRESRARRRSITGANSTGAEDQSGSTPNQNSKVPESTPSSIEHTSNDSEVEPTSPTVIPEEMEEFIFYPLFAVATYFDGSDGPKTGAITVDVVTSPGDTIFQFWHGHGGQSHRFILTDSDKLALIRGERVEIFTTEVTGHKHLLYIDPRNRIMGMEPAVIELSKEG